MQSPIGTFLGFVVPYKLTCHPIYGGSEMNCCGRHEDVISRGHGGIRIGPCRVRVLASVEDSGGILNPRSKSRNLSKQSGIRRNPCGIHEDEGEPPLSFMEDAKAECCLLHLLQEPRFKKASPESVNHLRAGPPMLVVLGEKRGASHARVAGTW